MRKSHENYHCAIDTPLEERMGPIAMAENEWEPVCTVPLKGRCMKCTKTLTAARVMSSDVVLSDRRDGRWRCRPCNDEENRMKERRRRLQEGGGQGQNTSEAPEGGGTPLTREEFHRCNRDGEQMPMIHPESYTAKCKSKAYERERERSEDSKRRSERNKEQWEN